MSHPQPHDHLHEHDLAGHSHTPQISGDNERRIFIAMLLTGTFMAAEIIGGLISGSLALIADAGHMATDTAALALAWLAFRLSRRPADPSRSYGFHRGEVLAAFVNGIAMIALVIWILVEAIQRLYAPVEVLGGIMLWIAVGGLLVNCFAFWLLHTGSKENLNIRGAAVHVAGDLLGSVAAIIAASVIILTGWTPVDPLLSIAVAMLVLRSAWSITKQSAHILDGGRAARAAACRYQSGPDSAHFQPGGRTSHPHLVPYSRAPAGHLACAHSGTCRPRRITEGGECATNRAL